ncbi:MAG: DUF6088 family protein [Mariniphaga sp.]
MKISDIVANKIDRFPVDYVFTYQFLEIEVSRKNSVVKALNRLANSGKIVRLSKGKYYKPRKTQFGALKPSAYQIAKDFIEQDGKQIGYLTGYSAFSALGLTTQISSYIQIGTNKYRRAVKRENYIISFIVQPNTITLKNIELLRILDALRFIREIPGTTTDDACRRLIEIFRELPKEQKSAMTTLALKYTNSVRALCGAILELTGADQLLLQKLQKSLNGVTEYKIPISESVLSTKSNWHIK